MLSLGMAGLGVVSYGFVVISFSGKLRWVMLCLGKMCHGMVSLGRVFQSFRCVQVRLASAWFATAGSGMVWILQFY